MEAILEQAFILLPLVVGAYISVSLMKLPDLSLESAYLFGAAAALSLADAALPAPLMLAILVGISLAGGALVGALTSTLNQILHVPFLLAAIIVNGLFHGIVQFILGNALLSLHQKAAPLQIILGNELGTLTVLVTLFLLVFQIIVRSQFGYALAAFGNNPSFCRQHGISTRYVVIMGVTLANACAGFSGYLFAQSNGFVDLSMAYGVVLTSITALVLARFFDYFFRSAGLHPRLLSPCFGVIGFFALQHMLLKSGINLKYFNAFQAVAVLGAIVLFYRQSPRQVLNNQLGV